MLRKKSKVGMDDGDETLPKIESGERRIKEAIS